MSSYQLNLAFVLLLPLVPAYLLFRALPSKATVSGKTFKGMEIKLGGAFSGYCVLVLLIFNFFPPPSSTWKITGKIMGDDHEPLESLKSDDFDIRSFAVHKNYIKQSGDFELTTELEPGPGTNLVIGDANSGEAVSLYSKDSSFKVSIDRIHKTITVDPFVYKPSYHSRKAGVFESSYLADGNKQTEIQGVP